MTKRPVLVLGARSDIGRAAGRAFAALGHPVQLAARNARTLADDKTDMELRHGVPVFDALATGSHAEFVRGLPELPEIAICAVGLMGDQKRGEHDAAAAELVMRSNYEGPAGILAALADAFEARGSGTLVGISSVAGERGRAANYIYGSAKAGFTAFLSGLRSRLARSGVHVATVLPGFVATKMTEGLDLPARLTAQPEDIAQIIVRAVKRRRNCVYGSPAWKIIMGIIKTLPEPIFKRLRI